MPEAMPAIDRQSSDHGSNPVRQADTVPSGARTGAPRAVDIPFAGAPADAACTGVWVSSSHARRRRSARALPRPSGYITLPVMVACSVM